MKGAWFVVGCMVAGGCERSEAKREPPRIVVAASATVSAVVTAPASAAASASGSGTGSGSGSGTGSGSGSGTAVARASTAAIVSAKASASASASARPVSARVSGNNFVIDASAPGDCKEREVCTMTLRLAADGEFHINKEYGYKFTAEPVAGVEMLGKQGPNVFSKVGGEFRQDSETVASMRVSFKAAAAGNVSVAGIYKMSVCSDANCQVEQRRVELTVPVGK